MRRIKNSVKAIIISICLVVVLAGSIVGVVLATRNKKGDPTGPSNPVGPTTPLVTYELTEEQKKMVESINKSATTSVEIAPEYDYSKYYFENGTKVDFEKIIGLFKNYFTYNVDNNTVIYYRVSESNGKVYFRSLYDYLANGKTIDYKNVFEVYNNFAYCFYSYTDGSEYVSKRLVVDLSDIANIKVCKEIEFRTENLNDLNKYISFNTTIYLKDGYFANYEISLENENHTTIQIFDYSANLLHEIKNVTLADAKNGELNRLLEDNKYYFVANSKTYLGGFINNKLYTYEFVENETSAYHYSMSNRFVFIEKEDLAEQNDPASINRKKYSYSILDLKTSEIKDIELEEGYLKATFAESKAEDYYYIFMQKPNSSNSNVEEIGLMINYDANHSVVVKYETDSVDDTIVYNSGSNILTKKAIYSSQNSIELEKIRTFGEGESVVDGVINNSTFVVASVKDQYIYDMNGEKIFEQRMGLIKPYNSGIYYGFADGKVYYLNVLTRTINEVTDFVYDENKHNVKSIMYGGGYYLTQNQDNLYKSLFEYSNTTTAKYDNVVKYEMVVKKTSYLLVTLSDNSTVSFVLDSVLTDNEDVNEDVSGASPYYGTDSGDHWSADGDTLDKYSYADYDGDSGWYVSSGTMVCAGSAVIGNIFSDSKCDFSFNYETDVIDTSNHSHCETKSTSSYAFAYSETHELTIRLRFWYWEAFSGGFWDHVGAFTDRGDATASELYCNVTAYALTTSTCYSEAHTADDSYSNTSSSTSIKKGGSFSLPSNPGCYGGTCDGYTALSESAPGAFSVGISSTSGSVSLSTSYLYQHSYKTSYVTYAHYDEHSYTVQYDAGHEDAYFVIDGTNSESAPNQVFDYTDCVERPEVKRPGYQLAGWEISRSTTAIADRPDVANSHGDYSKLIGEDNATLIFKATWSGKPYDIDFYFGYLPDTGKVSEVNILDVNLFGDTSGTYAPTGGAAAYGEKFDANGEMKVQHNGSDQTRSGANYVYTGYRFTYSNETTFNHVLNVAGADVTNLTTFKFNVLNVPTMVVSWAYEINGVFYNCNSNKANTSTAYGGTLLETWFEGHGLWDNNLIVYAIMEPKEYKISAENDTDYGRGSLGVDVSTGTISENYGTINNEYKDIQGVNWQYKYSSKSKSSSDISISTLGSNVIGSYSSYNTNVVITIKNNSTRLENYYRFDRIVLYGFGYRSGSNYYFANIIFKQNGQSGDFEIYVDFTGSGTLDTSKLYDGSLSSYTKLTEKTSIDDADDIYDGEYYFVDGNQQNINGFDFKHEVVSTFDYRFTLSVFNLGYAGTEDESGNVTISTSTVNGSGIKGFKVKPYFKSNYTANDTITNTKAQTTDKYTQLNTTGVTSRSIYFTTGSGTVTYVSNKYFWLNGQKYALFNPNDDSFFDAQIGFYDITSTDLKFEKSVGVFEMYRTTNDMSKGPIYYAKRADYCSTQSGKSVSKSVIYYDGVNVYYKGGSNPSSNTMSTTLNYVNYNSSQILAIEPTQSYIKLSTNPSHTENLNKYELETFLKSITVNSVVVNLTMEKYGDTATINTTPAYTSYVYNGFNNISTATAYTASALHIPYFGKTYKILQSYEFSVGSGDAVRNFVLYFTVNMQHTSGTNYNVLDNHIMYFLYSNVSSYSAYPITLTFDDIENAVYVKVTDKENVNGTATVDFYEEKVDEDNLLTLENGGEYSNDAFNTAKTIINKAAYFTTSTGSDIGTHYLNVVNAQDLRVIKISPTDGYIIESLTLTMAGLTGNGSTSVILMNFLLDQILMQKTGETSNSFYSLIQSEGVGVTEDTYGIKYSPERNHTLLTEYREANNQIFGIAYAETESSDWNVFGNKDEIPAFESIYILIGGLYDDITVDVKTASYIEFSFNDSTNALAANAESTQTYVAVNHSTTNDLLSYNLVKPGSRDTSQRLLKLNFYEKQPSQGTYRYDSDAGEYISDPNGKFVKAGENYYERLIYDAATGNYVVSTVGNYYAKDLFDVYNDANNGFKYMRNGDYFLSEIENLSILVDKSETSTPRYEQVDDTDVAFVRRYGSTVRVVFIGKYNTLFKDEVRIFASGTNYSAYFTYGTLYNDDGDDATGNASGTTAFSLLSDAEGRKNDDYTPLELNRYDLNGDGSRVDACENLEFTDKLIYMQIDSLQSFFSRTAINNRGDVDYTFEFARKYLLSVDVAANKVTMNVNSYVSNGKLKADFATNAIDYTSPYSNDNTNGNAAAINSASATSKIKVHADKRKTHDGSVEANNILAWNDSVFNHIKLVDLANSNALNVQCIDTFSPLMWIGGATGNCYQLDYYDTNYVKNSSWFNDVILTNIDYTYNDSTAQYTKNWQTVRKTDGLTNDAKGSPEISGYGVSYKYYSIPGYYLEYIIIETVDYGMIYIPIVAGMTSMSGQFKVAINAADAAEQKIYYSVVHTVNEATKDYYYTIHLYNDDDTDAAQMNSLALIANNISVNFFSTAYTGEINYYSNANDSKISSNGLFTNKFETGFNDIYQDFKLAAQTFTYDTQIDLNATIKYTEGTQITISEFGGPVMEGYTFLGWGSRSYDEYTEDGDHGYRFNNDNLSWNSSSKWHNLKGVVEDSTTNVLEGNYFDYLKRSDLLNLEDYGYDFYVKSQTSERNAQTGYFITDTGNVRSGKVENYNFWSVYASVFSSTLADAYRTTIASGTTSYVYNIDLFAIWKANTYAVEMNFNDFAKANGSSSATLAQSKNSSDYKWHDNVTNSILQSNSNSVLSNFSSEDDVYYFYVTFDKNDWFVVSGNTEKTNFNIADYSYRFTEGYDTTYMVSTTEGGGNKLEYVIDRYGYSWLGWFSEKLANTKENDFEDSNTRVFGSDYYYTTNSAVVGNKSTRTMPYLRNSNYTHASEFFVKLSDFTGENDNYKVNNYSEVVYKGEIPFDGTHYVYHYDYRSNEASGYYNNPDYLNKYDSSNKTNYGLLTNYTYQNGTESLTRTRALVYYDTALTLDSYKRLDDTETEYIPNNFNKEFKTISDAGGAGDFVQVVRIARNPVKLTEANYRFITLYAYWSSNNYNIVIDYRDHLDNTYTGDNGDSIERFGSTSVTNKDAIDSAITNVYFDDEDFDLTLNQAIPTRVGYDFVGWSFFYLDKTIFSTNIDHDTNKMTNGDLYKYNGLTIRESSYVLGMPTVTENYYSIVGMGQTFTVSTIISLYTEGNLIQTGGYNKLITKNEFFNDTEGDGNHYVYIYALWRAQTFSINVNLNIDKEDLINRYDQDSAYSIGFYKYDESPEPATDKPVGYVGIDSLFVRQKANQTRINNYADVFTDVVSNLTFVISFDEDFSTARFNDPNETNVTSYFYLKDLFAVSAGYHLINWLYNSHDYTADIIANTLETAFDYHGQIEHKNTTGSQLIQADSSLFDIDMYNKLYNSDYKNMTNTAKNNNIFETDNYNSLDSLDDSGESSNFGYIKIGSEYHYLVADYVDENTNYRYDVATEKYHLYFIHEGIKYYVIFKVGNVHLVNDFTYLYYPASAASKYVIRYDYEGKPYYVANNVYNEMKYVNITASIFASLSNISATQDLTASGKKFDMVNDVGNEYLSFTTRQFTVYAHWKLKTASNEDFVLNFNNGNNVNEEIEGQKVKGDETNPGLAGFYTVYTGTADNRSASPVAQTVNVDNTNTPAVYGYSLPGLDYNYSFYDNLVFDIIPFHNGRFLTDLCIDFDRIEDSGGDAGYSYSKVTTGYHTVRYRLNFNFEWSNTEDVKTNTILITTVRLLRLVPSTGLYSDMFSCKLIRTNNSTGAKLSLDDTDSKYQDLLSYLSVIDSVSFGSSLGIFDISDFKGVDSDFYGRRDVNMITFAMKNLLSSVYVTAKYSVQTYQLDIHHLFDEKGDTLIQSTGDKSIYATQYTQMQAGMEYDAENSFISSTAWTDTTPTGKNQTLATVPVDLANRTTYNVPYGYFIYGVYYASPLKGYRPMDGYYGELTNPIGYTGTSSHEFDGFEFIYIEGNYVKGPGGKSELILNGDGSDTRVDQGSPLLGSSVTFPTKSIRFNKSFYAFKGWFELGVLTGNGTYQFDMYDKTDEATYINRNITLYGYYYSSNTPTNLQFYTWNDDWNENSPAYLPYTNNASEYTLSAKEDFSSYIVNESGYLAPGRVLSDSVFIDDQNRVVLKSQIDYGVDSSKFSLDNYTTFEITTSDINTLNNILKTYWYYKKTYNILYTTEISDDHQPTFIKYDPGVNTEYSYVEARGEIVNTEEYNLFLDQMASDYTKLATLTIFESPIGDEVGSVRINGSDVALYYSDSLEEYYFLNPLTNTYYSFVDGEIEVVKTRLIPEKNAFYYYDNAGKVVKVRISSSADMTSASINVWDSATGDYKKIGGTDDYLTYSLQQQTETTYDYLGAELYYLVGSGDSARYYKYHRTPEEEYDDTSFLTKYEPRYYVEVSGVKYYTMLHKTGGDSRVAYKLYDRNGSPAAVDGSIVTLNNYYVVFNDEYKPIYYQEKIDANGSKYINPFINPNTITLNYKGMDILCYFDYQNNSKTFGLYETYNPGATSSTERFDNNVLFKYQIYTPINKNYALNARANGNVWESSDITLNAFPSYNIDDWYGNPEYVLLGYLNVSDMDIQTMKSGTVEGGEDAFSDSEYEYLSTINHIVKTSDYEKYLRGDVGATYDTARFATINFITNQVDIDGHSISLLYDSTLAKYCFVDETSLEEVKPNYYFSTTASNVVLDKNVSGSRVESEYTYVPGLQQIVNTEQYQNYVNNGNVGSYEVLANVNLVTKSISTTFHSATIAYSDGEYVIKVAKTAGSEVTYYLARTKNIVQIKAASGGQIYTAFENYINTRFSAGSQLDLRTAILSALTSKIVQFSLGNLLKSPLFVESYQLSTLDHKTIEKLTMRINVEFVFDHAEIIQYGLLSYCSSVPGLAVQVGEDSDHSPLYRISLSTSYTYEFNLITKKTQINQNIYAIPVYVPDVVKFTSESVDYSTGSSLLTIDFDKMNVSHFDIDSQKVYASKYMWTLDPLPANPTNEEKDLYNSLAVNADCLRFTILDADLYDDLVKSEIGCDVKLDTLIAENSLDVYSEAEFEFDSTEGLWKVSEHNAQQTINLAGLADGDYYVLSFYYQIGTSQNTNHHIQRVGNNIVKVTVSSGLITGASIIDNPKMA